MNGLVHPPLFSGIIWRWNIPWLRWASHQSPCFPPPLLLLHHRRLPPPSCRHWTIQRCLFWMTQSEKRDVWVTFLPMRGGDGSQCWWGGADAHLSCCFPLRPDHLQKGRSDSEAGALWERREATSSKYIWFFFYYDYQNVSKGSKFRHNYDSTSTTVDHHREETGAS